MDGVLALLVGGLAGVWFGALIGFWAGTRVDDEPQSTGRARHRLECD